MKYMLISMIFMAMCTVAYSQDNASNSGCRLIEKKQNLVQSELDMVIEKYKINFKKNILPQLRNTDGQSKQIKIGTDNPLVKSIQKLSVAVATYAALKEACYENPLTTNSSEKDEFTSTIIPNNPTTSDNTTKQ